MYEDITPACQFTHYVTVPCAGEVRYIPDPFDLEIHDEINMVWICDAHADERSMDT